MADASFYAKLEDRRVLQRVARELARYPIEIRELLDDFGGEAEDVFRLYAPEETGRLHKGIRARKQGDQLLISVRAVDPETGFDYVRVSRFGHTVSRIYAGKKGRSIHSQAQYTKAGGPRKRPLEGSAALRTPWGPRSSVKGFKPTGDWAEPAYDHLANLAELRLEQLGDKVVERIGRG